MGSGLSTELPGPQDVGLDGVLTPVSAVLLAETHLKSGHADVNHEHWEALKHVRKENLGYEEPYC